MSNTIREMFTEVPETYERINHILTFGMDILWRKKAVRAAVSIPGKTPVKWLDVCTGTGETAIYLKAEAMPETQIIALDFTLPMIRQLQLKPESHGIDLVQGDVKHLPFHNATFDIVTLSFATRNINVSDTAFLQSLKEFHRVLKPGGRYVNLETSQPNSPLIRKAFHGFVAASVKPVGWFLSGSETGYSYLSRTIRTFHSAQAFADLLKGAGFQEVNWTHLFMGAAAIHSSIKSPR